MTEKLEAELKKIGCQYVLGGATFKKDYNEELITDVQLFTASIKKSCNEAYKELLRKDVAKKNSEVTPEPEIDEETDVDI